MLVRGRMVTKSSCCLCSTRVERFSISCGHVCKVSGQEIVVLLVEFRRLRDSNPKEVVEVVRLFRQSVETSEGIVAVK